MWGIAVLRPRLARAGSEEFSTFDVEVVEADDESTIDHLLTRPPRAWLEEWERAPQAFRTSQGCLTSGEWFIANDLKVGSPVGRSARFDLDLRQSDSDLATYDYIDLWLHFPSRWGVGGVMFRPIFDKSRQDFALSWEVGADSSAFHAHAIFGFEDLFNNLWAWRQTKVGAKSEPYDRHPWEPALMLSSRHAHWRGEVSGRYLTPSRKRTFSDGVATERREALWGLLGHAALSVDALGFAWDARVATQEARSTDAPVALFVGDGAKFRRLSSGEFAVRRKMASRTTVEARYLYQTRLQTYGPPVGPSSFDAIDRVLQLDAVWAALPHLSVRAGGIYDRITIVQVGTTPYATYGTRNESRAYYGLVGRFGRMSVAAIEGVELDPEPYPVSFHHDKAFLHLQTTF